MKTASRVLLADDHAVVREGLRRILEPAFEIVGEVADGPALVVAADELRPDIIIADISMPLLNGIDATRQIRKITRKSKIIFLTMHPEVAYATAALSAGGSGYVLKSSMGAEILEAIREVLLGRNYITPSIDRQEVLVQMGRAGRREGVPSEPTPRQRQVLQLLAEGKGIKEVAALLNLSSKAVEFHKYKIMKQFGLRSNAELTKYAIKLGITRI